MAYHDYDYYDIVLLKVQFKERTEHHSYLSMLSSLVNTVLKWETLTRELEVTVGRVIMHVGQMKTVKEEVCTPRQ